MARECLKKFVNANLNDMQEPVMGKLSTEYMRERERIQRQWLEAGKFGESEEAKLGVAEHRKEGK